MIVDTRKAVALLAYVAMVGRPVARSSLADLLWPDAEPDSGSGSLRRTLSVLRSGLRGRWLAVDRRQVALTGEDITLDVSVARAALASASHEHGRSEACPACRRTLASATQLFRGEFLDGFALRDSASFDEWQTLEAEALRGEQGRALLRLIALEAAEGRWTEAIAAGRRLIALDPLDERRHQALMRVHADAGDRQAALRQYAECVRILAAELKVPPDEETTALYHDIRRARFEAKKSTGDLRTPTRPIPARRSAFVELDAVASDVLAAAAIMDDQVDPDLVADVVDHGEGAVASAINDLVARRILAESGNERDGTYRFHSEDMRTGVLEELGLARRRVLHRRAAAALETRFESAAGDGRAAARIAGHLEAGARPLEAATFHRIVAEAARRISDHAVAAAHLRAALLLGCPERVELYAAIGDAETFLGRYGEALVAYELGAALADPAGVAWFELRLGSLHLRRGALELAELHLAAALARVGDVPSPVRARVLTEYGLVAVRRGDESVARKAADEALAVAQASADTESEAQAENLLAMLARRAGDGDAARRHLRRSLERAGLSDGPSARLGALNNLALLERAAGNLDTALDLTDEALRRCVHMGDRHREAALRNNRADLLHAMGRQDEAAQELVRSVTAFGEVGDRTGFQPEIWKLVDW